MLGYTVVEPGSVLATHLTETVRRHADEILTRDATKHLIDELKQTSPAVVDELIPGVMKLAEVQQILQMLLRESRCRSASWASILETLGDYAPRTKDPILLTEYVRHRLARTICTRTATRRTGCTWSRSTRRWRTAFARASSTTSTGCSSACRRRRSRRPAG